MDNRTVKIEHRPTDDHDLGVLLSAAVDELNERYPDDPSDRYLDPRADFLLASIAGYPAGCIGIAPVDGQVAEMKRMYVAPTYRVRGIAQRLVLGLEEHALGHRIRKIRLETGIRQPEVIALYEKMGYRPTAPYGQYVTNPFSRCFEKHLETSNAT